VKQTPRLCLLPDPAAEEGRARDVAERLIGDVGLQPICLGGVDAFHLVDSVTRLWFMLALRQKLGRRLAFRVLVEPSPAPGIVRNASTAR